MDVSGRSRARVEERLTRLDEAFGSPTVTQTTFEVDAESYARAVERSRDGQADVHTIVRDGDGAVLLREADGEWLLPRGQTEPGEDMVAAARRVVRETAGLDCTITDTHRAVISGVRNGDDESDETVYRLSVVFTAEPTAEGCRADEAVRWDDQPAPVGELV